MTQFALRSVAPLAMRRLNRLADMYVLSPFVWKDSDLFRMLVRAVPRRDDEPRLKMAEIWHGVSVDGLNFDMDIAPVIFPGPDQRDIDGCEDPTVLPGRDGLRVWYTGYNEAQKTGRLMLASGPGVQGLMKRGVALNSTKAFKNPKESSIVRTAGGWRMFFEFARDGASLIGQANAAGLDGSWRGRKQSSIKPRAKAWDGWHLSPGPVIGEADGAPIMFYNGATKAGDWRIGWVIFDKSFNRVVARCDEPLVSPDTKRAGDATDIAFAASALEHEGDIRIYFSQSDRDIRCATVRRG